MVKASTKILTTCLSLLYFPILAFLIYSTDYCSTCAASQLWKYTFIASSPSWIIFLYLRHGWRKDLTMEHLKAWMPTTLVLVGYLAVAVVLAPLYIVYSFGQEYDIVYFGSVQLAFPSIMIMLMTLTVGVVSFNLASVFRYGTLREHKSLFGKVVDVWEPFVGRASLFVWLVWLIQREIGIVSQSLGFSTLFLTAMVIPVMGPISRRLHQNARIALSFLFGLGPVTLFAIEDVINEYPPIHPFIVIALLSSVAVCLSSAFGDILARYRDLRMPGRIAFSDVAIGILLAVAVTATWFYSHLLVRVG